VIDAAHAALFVAAEEQRCTSVRAIVFQKPDFASAVSKRDQLFAKQQDPHGVAIRRGQFRGQQCWHPILPHQVAHRRSPTNARDQFVVFLLEHGGKITLLNSLYVAYGPE